MKNVFICFLFVVVFLLGFVRADYAPVECLMINGFPCSYNGEVCHVCIVPSYSCLDYGNHNISDFWTDSLYCSCSHVLFDGSDCPVCTGVFVHGHVEPPVEPPAGGGGALEALGIVSTVGDYVRALIGVLVLALCGLVGGFLSVDLIRKAVRWFVSLWG